VTGKKKEFTYTAPKYSSFGTCLICKEQTLVSKHSIYKEVVFGKNSATGLVCKDCHHRVDLSIKVYEEVVLGLFGICNIKIWNSYFYNGGISENEIKKNINERIRRIKVGEIRYIKRGIPGKIEKEKATYGFLTEKQLIAYNRTNCPICKKKARSTVHHIEKWIVFKSNKKLGFPCRKCHSLIEESIGLHERILLEACRDDYFTIWEAYLNYGHITNTKVRSLARSHLMRLKINKSTRHFERIIQKKQGKIEDTKTIQLLRTARVPV
jgi:hypothetical protein